MLLLKPPILVCCWYVYIDDKLLHTIVAYPALSLKILAAKSNILNLLKANRKISRTTDWSNFMQWNNEIWQSVWEDLTEKLVGPQIDQILCNEIMKFDCQSGKI